MLELRIKKTPEDVTTCRSTLSLCVLMAKLDFGKALVVRYEFKFDFTLFQRDFAFIILRALSFKRSSAGEWVYNIKFSTLLDCPCKKGKLLSPVNSGAACCKCANCWLILLPCKKKIKNFFRYRYSIYPLFYLLSPFVETKYHGRYTSLKLFYINQYKRH